MNHPAATELFEFIDSRLAKERAREVAVHVAECTHCRRRIEFERSTRRVVQSEPLVRASERLAALVMINVAPQTRDPLALRLLGKLGSVVAMIVVLAVIGFAIAQISSVTDQSAPTSSSITKVVAPISDAYAKGIQTFIDHTSTITQAIENAGDAQFWKTICIVVLSVAVLAAADRAFGKRFIKLRP